TKPLHRASFLRRRPRCDQNVKRPSINPDAGRRNFSSPSVFDRRKDMNEQSHSLERRSLLRWLGAASLVLSATLAACAQSIPPRQVKRPPSHITAKERKNGGSGCWHLCDSSG